MKNFQEGLEYIAFKANIHIITSLINSYNLWENASDHPIPMILHEMKFFQSGAFNIHHKY